MKKTAPYQGKFDKDDLPVEIATLKTEIKWIVIVGSSIIAAALSGFTYLVVSEIPKQVAAASTIISGKLPENFSERFSKLEQKIDDLQSRYGGITPSSLLTLVPGQGQNVPPVVLQARLLKADKVIEASYDLDLPGSPTQLLRVSDRLQYVKNEYSSVGSVAPAIMSAEAHLVSYSLFSKGAYGTNLSLHSSLPTNATSLNVPSAQSGEKLNHVSIIANHMFECEYSTASAIDGAPADLSNVLVFQVRIKTCQQKQLAYLTWVRTDFDHVTIMYNGGPLTLVQSTFRNCTFKFGDDSNSRQALAIITAAAGRPVNIYLL